MNSNMYEPYKVPNQIKILVRFLTKISNINQTNKPGKLLFGLIWKK